MSGTGRPDAVNVETARQEALATGTTNHSSSAVGDLNNLCPSTAQQHLSVDEVLDALNRGDDEFTAVCHRPVDGQFTTSVVASVDASRAVGKLALEADVWFSVNPTRGPARDGQGRGIERDVARWAALWADLDVKPAGFRDLDECAAFVDTMSALIGSRPSAVIHSGHGLQPLWTIEGGELDDAAKRARAYREVRRFGRWVKAMANREHGANVDGVFNLDRILRAPNTTNWKDLTAPVRAYAVRGDGGPLTVDGIEEFLDEWAGPQIASDLPAAGTIVCAPEGWKFGEATCHYVVEMVVPWIEESDRPRAGRHQWAMSCAVRLAAAYRLGCIAEDDLKASLEHLEKALEHWCLQAGVPRELHHDEVGSAFRWAVTKVASFTDEQTRGELRDHSHTADITSDCAGDLEQAVASEIHRLRVREEAHKRFTAEKAGPASSFDAGLLDEILARPMQEQFVIEGLLPSAGSMLVVAQRKAGKTTLMLNMARSLLTGEPFLGTFWACKVSGRVAILNYEVSGGQLSRWAAEVGIPGDRLLVVNLRGQRNPLTHSADRAALAELLRQHGAEVVIVDPFSGAYTGSSQNDSGEVGAWLMDLDRFARNEAGARELILTAHAGWGNQGRVRGSSALEDWADSIVTLTLDTDNKSRYLRAIGRDVAVDEDRLSYDEDTRLLSFTGSGSRKQAQGRDKAEALMASVCEFVRANPGAAVSNIQTHLQALRRADQIPIAFQTQDVRNAITKAEEMGQLCRDTGGPGKPTKHYVIDPVQPQYLPTPAGRGS